MSEILLVNPRRRRRKKATTRRRKRRPSTRRLSRNPVASNPRRRRRRRVARRRNPIRRRRRSRSRRRNPVGFKQNAIKSQVTTAATGALGALGLDVALAYIPIPAMMKAGIPGKIMKGAAAIGLGLVAHRFLNVTAANAARLSEGALTVQFHGIGRELLGQFAPGVAMSAYINDEMDQLGYAGSGWNPSIPFGDEGNMSAYLGPGYSEPYQEEIHDSSND